MARYWLEITIETTSVPPEITGEILLAAGCGGVVCHEPARKAVPLIRKEPYRVTGYLPLRDGVDEELEKIQERLASLDRYFPMPQKEARPRLTLRRVKEENWAEAWKEYFRPAAVGRLLIAPPWEKVRPAPGQKVVEIDPGMAFGTGNHPSTRLSLLLLQEAIRGGETVYDIGTGTGILAVGAAKLGAARVKAVDIDPTAVAEARMNVKRNKVEDRVEVREGNLVDKLEIGADLVVANIVAAVILALLPQLPPLLNPGGRVILSGIIADRAGEVKDALLRNGLICQKEVQEECWTALLAGMDGA